MQVLLEKKILSEHLLIGIALLAVVLFFHFSTQFFAEKAGSAEEGSFVLPPASEEKVSPAQREPGQNVKVLSEDAYEIPEVIYSENTFSPNGVRLESNNCVLRIINKSNEELVIRLSPHSEKDAIGFHYSPIPSGQSLAIDPRYGQADAFFHNHKKSDQNFRVRLGPSCL